MGLEIEEREMEGITILDMRGRLVAGEEAEILDAQLADLLSRGKHDAIANLQRVSTIDSTGLGTLVGNYRKFEQAGGALKLLHVSKAHAELLVLTKLSTVFQIFDDEKAAVNSFFPDRNVPHFDILEFVKSEAAREKDSEDATNRPEPDS